MPARIPARLRPYSAAARVLLLMTAVLGLAYPLAVTGAAQVLFPARADGSLIERDGAAAGSSLIGQDFDGEEWFHPRPSAAGDDGYDGAASSASNLGPNSEELLAQVRERRSAVAAQNGVAESAVPPDAVTASGSGLDPHISPAYAAVQTARVADARGLPPGRVRDLVAAHTDGRALGFIGEPAVNVVTLNRDLAGLG
ncbi:K+-transporting ATPase ATPase C chain [Murinocardiopsis flavida]|uniref:Potassium-transporting ATPase KdpC subunit n=1 Tax=Murinocardiopsis flavida TaxID=645275 RepID=A0A2P8CM04_9ACTN|nr:potassium-transporting ATPase subunit KdpC [Murinocardiopsis flavida]PSK85991.1 K+-transporting ATPase ATPase C chain [Murinocardiopsis flavida]